MKKSATTIGELAKIASTGITENKFCFVIMSFSKNPIIETYFDEAVKPTLEKFGIKCVRIDEEYFNGSVSSRIRNNIENSLFIIADLTEDKPNCYFEAGYAFAKGKEIIFMRLDAPGYSPKIQFDLKDFQHILYRKTSDLRIHLEERIKHILS